MTAPQPNGLILIVDDIPGNLGVLTDALTDSGFEIAVASDGEMALEQITYEMPDLILLDVVMPGIDGYETCRRLKADPATRDIPVIFMTAHTETTDRVQGFNLGAVDFITKPFEQQEVLARVRAQVRLQRLTRMLAEQNAALQRKVEEHGATERALQQLTADLERELSERARAEEARAALQEEIIRVHEARLAELSTPLIPITDRIVVMPLIGTMDAARADQILGAALEGVHTKGAEVVILDITGVRAVDSGVACALLRTASALRLLGAEAVITGMRAEVAQALVELQLDLGEIVTHGKLQGGIAHALGRSGDGALRLRAGRSRG